MKTQQLGGSIGALAGLYYAFQQKSGFWGYAGYFILGSLAGTLTGNLASMAFKKPESPTGESAKGSAQPPAETK